MFLEQQWELVYSKLKTSSSLLAKIDMLAFDHAVFSSVHLKELHNLYCSFENKDFFPKIFVEDDVVEENFEEFRKSFSKRNNDKLDKSFLKKVIYDEMIQEDYESGPDLFDFEPSVEEIQEIFRKEKKY